MVETVRTTSLIFAIVAGVLIYVHFLGFTGTPAAIANKIVHWNLSPTVVLIGILCLYLFLGMFIDGIGMVLLTVPIVLPTIKTLGIDPIVFGVLVVRMVEIGLMTPPVGLNVYVLKGVAKDVSMGDIFRGCGWFVFVDIINVAILLAFPQIMLLIPHSMIRGIGDCPIRQTVIHRAGRWIMGRSYSLDLRKRVVAFVDGGRSRRGAAADLQVSPSFSVKLVARHRRTGTLEAQRQGRPPGTGKLAPHRDFLLGRVKETPDITMPELVAELDAGRASRLTRRRCRGFCARLGSPIKKPCWPRSAHASTSPSSVTCGSTSASRSCAACRTASPSSTRRRPTPS